MWIYPTPGLTAGLGTAFAMNTFAGGNVISLSLDRGSNVYVFKDTDKWTGQGKRSLQKVPQYQWHWVAMTLEMGTATAVPGQPAAGHSCIVKVYMGAKAAGASASTMVPDMVLSVNDAALQLPILQTAGKFSIGTEWDQDMGSDWLCGMVHEFRAWNNALAQQELSFVMRQPIAQPTGPENRFLVAYLQLQEGKGTTTADSSSSHMTATLHGATWVSTFTPYDQLPEVSDTHDRSVMLDGRRGFIVGDSATKKLPVQVTALTVMAWALPNAEGLTEQEGCVVAFNKATGDNENMVCYDSASSMFYYKDNKKNVYMGAGECGTSPPGVWHHIAYTIDPSNNGVLYIDAEPKATFKSSIRPSSTSRFSMGQEWDGNAHVNLRDSNHFAGAIDEVAIYDRALTGDEIKAAYGVVHIALPAPGMLAYWTFDEGIGRLSHDKSGNGNTAILRRGTHWFTGHSVSIASWGTYLTRLVLAIIGLGGLSMLFSKRDQVLDTLADLAGSLFPSAKGYKVVPQGEEFGGLLDGEEN